MKRLFLFVCIVALAFSAAAQKGRTPKLSNEDLQKIFAANDSVINEGNKLYIYEKLNWTSTDEMLAAHLPIKGSFLYETGSVIHVIFPDKNNDCVGEVHFDLRTAEIRKMTEKRPLSDEERGVQQRNERIFQKTLDANIPIYGFPEKQASFNIEIIRISQEITRVYVFMGALVNNMIPFGNDFSCDFDNNDSLVASRSYHHSFAPITWEEGTQIKQVCHSHTQDNPYITPTDICTFKLYGWDLYHLATLYVYSPALHSYFVFLPAEMMIITSTDAKLPRNKKSKKHAK